MRLPPSALIAIAALLVPPHAIADSGEDIFKTRCSLCHEGGAGGAPRIGNRSEWEPRAARGKLALYETALKGKPNTAMMARGGFRDLSDHDVMSAVDYMVARTGLDPALRPEPAAVIPPEPMTAPTGTPKPLAPDADDRTVTARVAEALRAELAPEGSRVEMNEGVANVSGLGVRVGTRQSVVWLRGMVRNAEIIERAEAIAQVASGGRKIENRLISASIFEWD